jgi:hypothetical protein
MNGMTMNLEPKLCFVKGPWAYFTTWALEEQWGDDWNDAPYEHNAGPPYVYGDQDKERGIEPWTIIKVAWDGDFWAPCDFCFTPLSVQQINHGVCAWLCADRVPGLLQVAIPAGTTLSRFIELIHLGRGNVYLPVKPPTP